MIAWIFEITLIDGYFKSVKVSNLKENDFKRVILEVVDGESKEEK